MLLFFLVAIGVIPFPVSADHSPKIEIVGSTTVLPIASRAAERFEKFKSSHHSYFFYKISKDRYVTIS